MKHKLRLSEIKPTTWRAPSRDLVSLTILPPELHWAETNLPGVVKARAEVNPRPKPLTMRTYIEVVLHMVFVPGVFHLADKQSIIYPKIGLKSLIVPSIL